MDQCIILDLDNTLVKTLSSDEIKKIQETGIFDNPKYMDIRSRFYNFDLTDVDNKGNIEQERVIGIKRPYLDEFLAYCESRFKGKVFVFTAATRKYGNGIINSIFKKEPLILYSREQCIPNDGAYEKPLINMISNVEGLNSIMTMGNAFIVDDRRVSLNPNPNNGILIPEYDPRPDYESIKARDESLLQLMSWFERDFVKRSNDIRNLYKGDIFSTPPELLDEMLLRNISPDQS